MRRHFRAGLLGLAALASVLGPGAPAVATGPYAGPLIDAHSHLPNLQLLDVLVAAMARHRVARVALLGVGGVQREDPAWIEAAARRFPDRVIPLAPVPDPLAPDAARRLEARLADGRFRGAGEVHLHQASRKIRRAADDPAFLAVLDVVGRRGVPVVIHDELTPETTAELERALGQRREARVVLAHAGAAEPSRVAALLSRHPNLLVDVSGMHFLRSPTLATERGPLRPEWRAFLAAHADRVLVGVDVWAPQLFRPEVLDRLLGWTRRVLGELPPEVAERVGYGNAMRLFRLE